MPEARIDTDEINIESFEDDFTSFSDDEHVEVRRVNFELEQISKLHGMYRKITVFNDTQCYQSIQNKHKRKYKYRVDMVFLDPRPFRARIRPWGWLYLAIILFVIDALMFIGGIVETSATEIMVLFVGLLVGGAMSVIVFFYLTRDRVFFRTQYGKIRLVELINKNPDNASFSQFVSAFVKQINEAKESRGYSQAKSLARELKELRRLKDESVVPVLSYEKAKKLIFRHKAFKSAM